MRTGLYPLLAGVPIALWLLAEVFETHINTASPLLKGVLLGAVGLIAIGAVLLALWDTKQ